MLPSCFTNRLWSNVIFSLFGPVRRRFKALSFPVWCQWKDFLHKDACCAFTWLNDHGEVWTFISYDHSEFRCWTENSIYWDMKPLCLCVKHTECQCHQLLGKNLCSSSSYPSSSGTPRSQSSIPSPCVPCRLVHLSSHLCVQHRHTTLLETQLHWNWYSYMT